MKNRSWWLTLLFLLILSLPLTTPMPAPLEFWQPEPGSSLRKIAEEILEFPAAYQEQFNESFRFRRELVRLFYRLQRNILGETVFPNVIIGKQGWLYYTGEGNLDEYQRTQPFTEAELTQIRQRLVLTQDRLNQQGIAFLLVVAPGKEVIYPEFLPQGIRPLGAASKLDQLLEVFRLRGGPNILDLRPVLQREKSRTQVYFRTDTHWNSYGAFVAYREILLQVGRSVPGIEPYRIDDFDWQGTVINGDLVQYLPTGESLEEKALELVPRRARRARILPVEEERTLVTEVDDPTLPRAVVFHDSFANGLIPYLSEHFSRINYQHRFDLDFQLIEQERPDVVIYEIAERYLKMLAEPWR